MGSGGHRARVPWEYVSWPDEMCSRAYIGTGFGYSYGNNSSVSISLLHTPPEPWAEAATLLGWDGHEPG